MEQVRRGTEIGKNQTMTRSTGNGYQLTHHKRHLIKSETGVTHLDFSLGKGFNTLIIGR